MLHILLVDDEPLVLELMSRQIDWNRYDMEICGRACDGYSAIEFLKTHEVDIIFTDIKMPHMDGLELIHRTHEFLPNITYVVISSYDDYRLVRESFRDGVFDYILKIDIDDPKVVDPLLTRLKHHASARKKVLPNNFSLEQIFEKMNKTQAELDAFHYGMMTLSLGGSTNAVWALELLSFLKKNTTEYVFGFFDWKVVILCYHVSQEVLRGTLHYLLSQILERQGDGSCELLIGLSGICGKAGVPLLYRQTEQALSMAFYRTNTVTLYPPEEDMDVSAQRLDPLFEEIRLGIRESGGLAQLGEEIDRLFAFAEASPVCPTVLKSRIAAICEELLSFYRPNHPHNEAVKARLRDRLAQARSFAACQTLTDSLLQDLLLELKQFGVPLADVLQAYVEQNYSDQELTLQSISQRLQINKRVLAACLLEKTGIHFKQYLNEVRIRHAMALLKNTSLRVSEIAERVGYTNVEHFSRLFSSQAGCAPSAYKKSIPCAIWHK